MNEEEYYLDDSTNLKDVVLKDLLELAEQLS